MKADILVFPGLESLLTGQVVLAEDAGLGKALENLVALSARVRPLLIPEGGPGRGIHIAHLVGLQVDHKEHVLQRIEHAVGAQVLLGRALEGGHRALPLQKALVPAAAVPGLPLLLGVVEAGVGLTEQLLILGLAVGGQPHADGGRHRDMVLCGLIGDVQHPAQGVRLLQDPLFAGDLPQKQDELIPSNPPHQPLLLEGGVENVADLLKELVPLKMAVAVVDLLKVVQVDDQQGALAAAAPALLENALDHGLNGGLVVQARHPVLFRPLQQGQLRLFPAVDVPDVAEQEDIPRLRILVYGGPEGSPQDLPVKVHAPVLPPDSPVPRPVLGQQGLPAEERPVPLALLGVGQILPHELEEAVAVLHLLKRRRKGPVAPQLLHLVFGQVDLAGDQHIHRQHLPELLLLHAAALGILLVGDILHNGHRPDRPPAVVKQGGVMDALPAVAPLGGADLHHTAGGGLPPVEGLVHPLKLLHPAGVNIAAVDQALGDLLHNRAGLPMALGGDRGVEPAGRDVILPHADPRLADRDLKPFLTPAEPVLHGLAGGDVQNHPA